MARGVENRGSFGNNRRGLDLHSRKILDQTGDLYRSSRRIVRPHDFAIRHPQFRIRGDVFTLVNDVPSHAYDVLWLGAGLLQDHDNIAQRLARLRDKVRTDKLLCGIPADLPANENLAPARRDTVRIAAWLLPPVWLEDFHYASPRNL